MHIHFLLIKNEMKIVLFLCKYNALCYAVIYK
jgi:hypothetical protein